MAENMDLDQLEIAILGQLYTLEDDVLTRLCTHLKVSKGREDQTQSFEGRESCD